MVNHELHFNRFPLVVGFCEWRRKILGEGGFQDSFPPLGGMDILWNYTIEFKSVMQEEGAIKMPSEFLLNNQVFFL